MEHVSRVFDHVKGKCVLGFKVLVCAFFDGKSTLPIDFSIHSEKGKDGDYGLTDKQRRKRFSKKRDTTCPDFQRAMEATRSKLDVAIEMLKRAWSYPVLRAQYVLCDSWFTCERLLEEVRKIGNGAMLFVGLAKMGNTRYTVGGKRHNAIELTALYERERIHGCRKYKCQYRSLQGRLGEQSVRTFLDDKLMVVLEGFDILKQLKHVEYTQTSSYVSSKRTNVIPSYAMACVVYRLNYTKKSYKPSLHWY